MAVLPVPMDRNCNLELRLSVSPSTSFSGHDSGDQHPRLHHFLGEESSKNSQQQMTIFYNGRVCVGDFTEEQARAIMMLAARHTEKKATCRRQKLEPSSPEQSNSRPGSGSGSGISMKRSLQRFLQKRKHRIQSASPYNH